MTEVHYSDTREGVTERALLFRREATKKRINLDQLRVAIENFVKDGDWHHFWWGTTEYRFDEFEKFCDQWLTLPFHKLRRLFDDEPEVLQILDDAAASHIKRKEARALRAQGLTQQQIADEVGVSRPTVSVWQKQEDSDVKKSDNVRKISKGTECGNNRTYTLRRLQRYDAEYKTDLAERVIAGDMSANAAAIEAGFRKKTVTVELSLEGFRRALEKHFPGHRIVAD